jgi:hypothetical protein
MGRDAAPLKLVLIAARAVVPRPDLWRTALRQGRRMAPNAWWRRAPFLPVPDKAWLRFRLEAQYGGDGTGPVVVADLIHWLEWARAYDRAVGLA